MDTRNHHYVYAHKLLPRLFFDNDDGRFHELLDKDRGRYLRFVWNRLGDDIADPIAVNNQQLGVERLERQGRELFLVDFPLPVAPPEAYFAALVYVDGVPSRYLTLERSLDLQQTGDTVTMLGEWTKDGNHANFGTGPSPTMEEFIHAIDGLFSNEPLPLERTPVSTGPVQPDGAAE